ncbi:MULTISPECIES: exodeoxyribonuclease VII small subunit [unclassified Pseudonocardia]|uniref:exodeoxyribonuclease VII small subunit n=1 Tax=unclassified Pseudonocardia TaxID=2619320 RepID=UPI0001FFE923|nr:exodeoxyribonuclease VII small subunit [Pseudonocardia sp. Ae707_Ps1]OLM16478.1 Exodeoxyribonuclease VII small subunit [Pseudonocardia sp. Ae707_Ps1]
MSERPAVDTLGYEQARDELVEVVRALEVGGLGLDESVAMWERGEALASRCEDQLAGARTRIEDRLAEAESGDDSADET